MVVGFHQTDKGMAIAYQAWRSGAFDPSQPATWPVTPETL